MARITSSAENTVIMTAFPARKLKSHFSAFEKKDSNIQEDGTGGNPMIVCEFTVDEGEFKDRRVGYYNVMLGGKTKKGDVMPIRQLLELIDALKVGWATNPSAPLVARPFKRVKGDGGSIMFIDPDTNTRITNIDYDPEQWMNRQCNVNYGIRKQDGTDREFNEVKSVEPL